MMQPTLRCSSFFLSLLCCAALLVTGCDGLGDDGPDELPPASGIVIGNSGVFGGEGSLTVYDPETEATTEVPAQGGFVTSLALRGDNVFVLANTADVINRYTAEDFTQTGQVQSPRPPRGMAFASEDKAYVTNLSDSNFETGEITFPGTVSVVDLETNEITGELIEVGDYPEGIAVAEGKAFVANSGLSGASSTLSVIDASTDAMVGTVEVGCFGPDAVFVDDEEDIVVVCLGRSSYAERGATDGEVVFLDPQSEAVVSRVPLGRGVGSANGSQAAYYAADAEELYVIDGADTVFRIDTDRNAQAGTLTVPPADDLVGLTAVAYDAADERLYLGRFPVGDDGTSADVTSSGAVVILGRDGAQQGRIPAGIAPAHIEISREE